MSDSALQQLDELRGIVKGLETLVKGRPPIDYIWQISATNGLTIDYHDRKHMYIWLPSTALTLSFEDYGQGTIQAQVWVNLGMPPGMHVFAPNNASTTPIFVRCTDEVIP